MGSLIERKKKIMMMQGQSLLPPGYKRIEYLQSSGTQYISTNYMPTEYETRSVMKIGFSSADPGGDNIIYGANRSGGSGYYAELYSQQRFYGAIALSRYSAIAFDTVRANEIIEIDLNTTDIAITKDNYTVKDKRTGTYSTFNIGFNTYIFAWNANGTAQYMHKNLRLYSLELYRNNELSANFIPCVRKIDDKPGLYDTVSQVFYTNAGTGEFIVPQ